MGDFINRFIARRYRKILLFKPMPNRSIEVENLTMNTEFLQRSPGHVAIMQPDMIFPIFGLKNVAGIAIQKYNSGELLDLTGEDEQRLTEKVLSDLLDNAEAAGRLMAQGEDPDASKGKNVLLIIMIASIMAAVLSLMMYLKMA